MANDLETKAINVIRGLAMDAVQKANSGHPGTAMALAPLAHVLHTRIMRHDATEPGWPARDRFILSAGHASMLLYSMLYLTGFGLTLDDIEQFRQWGSRTAGHPEHGHAAGIEVTTGPLGQGFANGVGMAIAEANLRARFGTDVCDHRIFAICSDGDLLEGVSHEAGSLAGHLRLGRLVYVYDDNHITIDGQTELALTDDAGKRFEAYGWHVVRAGEVAEDTGALEAALREGIAEQDRPSLIILRSHIGYPSPNFTDSPKAHGEPLGADEVARVKEILGLPPEETFWVPEDVAAFYREAGRRGKGEREAWAGRVEQFHAAEPELAEEYHLCLAGRGRAGLGQARTGFVWSHDSVGLGEDGPTHQPIEHLASLRAIPGLRVIRPADANETSQCWRIHVNSDGPSAFILSRQKLPVLEGTAERAEAGVARGAYVLVDEPGDLDLVLIGTGSEVSICVAAQKTLAGDGVSARVVSMPSWELFQLLTGEEQAAVLPPEVPTLAVEAAATLGWERYADDTIGLDRFGASAPGATALEKLGFTPECVVDRARALLAAGGRRRRGTPPGFGGA